MDASKVETVRIRVASTTQVNVDGVLYGPGEEVDAPPEIAATAVRNHWAVLVGKPAAAKAGKEALPFA